MCSDLLGTSSIYSSVSGQRHGSHLALKCLLPSSSPTTLICSLHQNNLLCYHCIHFQVPRLSSLFYFVFYHFFLCRNLPLFLFLKDVCSLRRHTLYTTYNFLMYKTHYCSKVWDQFIFEISHMLTTGTFIESNVQ